MFTADLKRARRELAVAFDRKASTIAPNAAGTDIFGGLWRAKVLIDSATEPDTKGTASKIIWILSDMMNETPTFPMPNLMTLGPEQMLERARANNLLVPLAGYVVHIAGASTDGLTPHEWVTIKSFWGAYFKATGATLVSYSAESEPAR